MPMVADTHANIICQLSLIKASKLWMCSSICNVHGWPDRFASITLVLAALKHSTHSFCWVMVHVPYLHQHSAINFHIFDYLCPQKAHYGVSSLDGIPIHLNLFLSIIQLNDEMLHGASYLLSHEYTLCHASLPPCCFYCVI